MGVYDAQDWLLSYGSTSYTYTANGELRTKTDAGGTTTYTHDVRGNLVQVDLPSGDVIQYLVDGQDRRVGKKKNGVLEKAWLYRNQLNPAAELDGAGNLVGRFVYGSKEQRAGVRGAWRRDVPRALRPPRVAEGVGRCGHRYRRVACRLRRLGQPHADCGNGRLVPFGFAGGMFDAETGQPRFGARDYDARVGRWTGKDPIGLVPAPATW